MRWGVLGTGTIASVFASQVDVAVVGSRSLTTAQTFAAKHQVPVAYGSYDDVLADGSVDAVYIATPHPMHREWALAAAKAGKHVLVEKPAGMSRAEAAEMIDAAQRHDVFFMEAFMYRCHPQIALFMRLLRDGAIGEPRMLTASFGFRAPFDPAGRLFDPALGGGGILDVGCYPASMAVLVDGTSFSLVGGGVRGPTGVDERAAAVVQFESGLTAQLACAVSVELENQVVLGGTEGSLVLPRPWLGDGTVVLRRPGRDDEVLSAPADRGLFKLEADEVEAHVDERQAPAMPWAHTLATAGLLDQWIASV